MEMGIGYRKNFGGFREVADKIQHGAMTERTRGAEREAEDGAEMIFELAGDSSFDGPMTGIVDARSHFVGEQVALVFEEFDGEDTHIFEGLENAMSGSLGRALDVGLEARGGG